MLIALLSVVIVLLRRTRPSLVKTGVVFETLIAPFWPAGLATVKPVGTPFESRPKKVSVFAEDLMLIIWPLETSESAFFAGVDSAEASVEGVAEFVAAGTSCDVVPEETIEEMLSWPVTELKPRNATRTISSERATFEDFFASSAAFLY